jgi:hypothetical protein
MFCNLPRFALWGSAVICRLINPTGLFDGTSGWQARFFCRAIVPRQGPHSEYRIVDRWPLGETRLTVGPVVDIRPGRVDGDVLGEGVDQLIVKVVSRLTVGGGGWRPGERVVVERGGRLAGEWDQIGIVPNVIAPTRGTSCRDQHQHVQVRYSHIAELTHSGSQLVNTIPSSIL